jgi:hypothetical protein
MQISALWCNIVMDVKKNQKLFKRPICEYYNGCKKNSTTI